MLSVKLSLIYPHRSLPSSAMSMDASSERLEPRSRASLGRLTLPSTRRSDHSCRTSATKSGGDLLKLIDVSAGLVAAKHAGGPCVTISAEYV